MPDLKVDKLQRDGLGRIDLAVPSGRALALHGASGSGKTLLLRAIADLDPNDGAVSLGDLVRGEVAAHAWRRRLAYVPAESGWWGRDVGEHAADWDPAHLRALGFETDVLGWEIRRLSSGERQRLAIARALAGKPQGLLLDEPTANLDTHNTALVEELVAAYRAGRGAPVVWVSHSPEQRHRVADEEREMRAGELL